MKKVGRFLLSSLMFYDRIILQELEMKNNHTKNHNGKERRSFFRYEHKTPMHYSLVTKPHEKGLISKTIRAISKNLRASGVLFATDKAHIPDLSSILILDLDYRTARICEELEKRALIVNNKLLGKVVRLQRVADDAVNVGVAFITKSDSLSEDLKKLVG